MLLFTASGEKDEVFPMNRKTRFFFSLALFAVLAAISCVVWWRLKAVAGAKRCNVLLITLDTTRADHLGCYGSASALTPALDKLAANGVLFEKAFCNVPLTLPSHATILTGLYPPEHGLRINATKTLPRHVPILSEILSSNDYRTAAFLASHVLASKFGLNRGFHVYDDSLPGHSSRGEKENPYRSGDDVVDVATSWIAKNSSNRFFCWVHLYDPHFPYYTHENLFGTRFKNTPYDAEIAFVDLQVGRLLDSLETCGIKDRTLIVIVGDHGESLEGEHNEPRPFHGYMLYNSTMRVPLIFSLPGRIQQGGRVPSLVSLIDLFPTILGLLGLSPTDAGSGRDLGPALRGQMIPARPCYAETEYPKSYGWSPLQTLITERWKYIRTPRTEVYDLLSDPNELRNLVKQMPEKVKDLDMQLSSIEKGMTLVEAESINLTANDRRVLESLGYLAGQASLPSGRPDSLLKDIKDMVTVITMSYEAEKLTRQAVYKEALALWRTIVEESPECFSFRNGLGCVLLENDLIEEAVTEFKRLKTNIEADDAHKHDLLYPLVLNNLAFCMTKADHFEDALPIVQEAIKIDPLQAQFHHTLATVYKGLKLFDNAQKSAKTAMSLDSSAPDIILFLAELDYEMGNNQKAIELALKTLKLELKEKDQTRAHELLNRIYSQ